MVWFSVEQQSGADEFKRNCNGFGSVVFLLSGVGGCICIYHINKQKQLVLHQPGLRMGKKLYKRPWDVEW
jgi:hypothetical protein